MTNSSILPSAHCCISLSGLFLLCVFKVNRPKSDVIDNDAYYYNSHGGGGLNGDSEEDVKLLTDAALHNFMPDAPNITEGGSQ